MWCSLYRWEDHVVNQSFATLRVSNGERWWAHNLSFSCEIYRLEWGDGPDPQHVPIFTISGHYVTLKDMGQELLMHRVWSTGSGDGPRLKKASSSILLLTSTSTHKTCLIQIVGKIRGEKVWVCISRCGTCNRGGGFGFRIGRPRICLGGKVCYIHTVDCLNL